MPGEGCSREGTLSQRTRRVTLDALLVSGSGVRARGSWLTNTQDLISRNRSFGRDATSWQTTGVTGIRVRISSSSMVNLKICCTTVL